MSFETVSVTVADGVAQVELNRPDKANAMNHQMWADIRSAFRVVDDMAEVRVAVISGSGNQFSAGIDLAMLAGLESELGNACEGRSRERLRRKILDLQDALTSIERCRKPVIAAIHGACIGAGVDLITCCDMRYATVDTYFQVKEIDVGMAADVGTLQRMPKLVPDGIVRELVYTGRRFDAEEARQMGLVNRVYGSVDEMRNGVAQIAASIAHKSPLAIRGSKEMLVYSRDHSVAEGLNYVATWNAAMLLSADLTEAMTAAKERRPARFGE